VGGGGRNWRLSEGTPFTAKTGAARGEEPDPASSSAPASSTSMSSCRRLFPPRRKAAPSSFTDACAMASGFASFTVGENKLPRPSEDASAFEPRGNAPFAPRRRRW
jgi:hypothetical protein